MTIEFNRRRALTGLLALGALTACGRAAADPLLLDIGAVSTLEHRHGARIGLFAVDLSSGAEVANRPAERFAMCSTFKAYAAARVLQMVDQGKLTLDAVVPVVAADIVANSPVTSFRVGGEMTLRELCEAALTRSDNAAGNLLLRAIGGPSEITAFARTIGDRDSRLDRWETDLNSAHPGDLRDTTTPQALCGGYRELLAGSALRASGREMLEKWMRATETSNKRFRAALPAGWTSADKTGAGAYGSTNDAGLLIGPDGQRVVAAVLTRSLQDREDAGPLDGAIADSVRLTLAMLGHG
ncbi:class A beta-lactamase [Mycolicibacterium hippocampi]|uniref:Beta-lactamase n=1 Tax=Mycolicibacterium hippocampi TaxID=659824 RepID=A0A850PJL1_9MYCO|nr:Class A beta-lactamase [Mycolicibacterium hippocampi]